MKYINIGRNDFECLKNVIRNIEVNGTYRDEKNRKKDIENTKKLPINEIRYIDNQYRIYEARRNWKRIIEDVIDLLI